MSVRHPRDLVQLERERVRRNGQLHDAAGAFGALPDGFRATDAGNADRFIAIADGQARYVHAWSKWIVYMDGRWVTDHDEALVTELAKQVARRMIVHALDLEGKERDDLWAHARRCEQAHVIAAMLR